MKCKTVRDIHADVNCHPPYVSTDEAGRRVIKAGTVICRDEFPLADCVTLVRNGLADPADEECLKACDRTATQLEAAKEAMEKLLNPQSADENDDEEDEDEDDE